MPERSAPFPLSSDIVPYRVCRPPIVLCFDVLPLVVGMQAACSVIRPPVSSVASWFLRTVFPIPDF